MYPAVIKPFRNMNFPVIDTGQSDKLQVHE